MIIVALFGGLGNQLFQYACGKAVAERLGVELQLDTRILTEQKQGKNATLRDFELSVFDIKASVADRKELEKYVPNLYNTSKWSHQLYRIKRLFNGRSLFIERVGQRHSYIPTIEKVKDNTYLYGYFQTEKFFKDISSKIREDFQLNPQIIVNDENRLLMQKMSAENSVAIHVRRGDYKNSRFTLLDIKTYYLKAIKKIKEQVKNPKFYVFSNDIEFVKTHFSKMDIDCEIVDINSGQQSFMDMVLMSNCKHNIIANSSFSWWSAWLNDNPDKIVIAPQNWYSQNIPMNDMIPAKWNLV